MKTVVYPGSFDPFTMGHKDILDRALQVFHKVIVAVVTNPSKKCLLTLEERVEVIRESIGENDRIEIESFDGLLINFMNERGVNILVKGLRAVSDFEFELQMALMNRKLDPRIETVFLMTSSEYAFLSSSKVREIASLGGKVEGLISPYAEKMLIEKFKYISDIGQTLEKE